MEVDQYWNMQHCWMLGTGAGHWPSIPVLQSELPGLLSWSTTTEIHAVLDGWQWYLQAAHGKLGLEEPRIELEAYCFVAHANNVREISPLFPCLVLACSPASHSLGATGNKDFAWCDWTSQKLPKSWLPGAAERSCFCCQALTRKN